MQKKRKRAIMVLLMVMGSHWYYTYAGLTMTPSQVRPRVCAASARTALHAAEKSNPSGIAAREGAKSIKKRLKALSASDFKELCEKWDLNDEDIPREVAESTLSKRISKNNASIEVNQTSIKLYLERKQRETGQQTKQMDDAVEKVEEDSKAKEIAKAADPSGEEKPFQKEDTGGTETFGTKQRELREQRDSLEAGMAALEDRILNGETNLVAVLQSKTARLASVNQQIDELQAPLLAPSGPQAMAPFDSSDFDVESYVNARINNIENKPFLERQEVVDRVLEAVERAEVVRRDKARVVVLWSPRGTGKSSLLRELVLKEPSTRKRAENGRVMIADMKYIPRGMDATPKEVLSALVLEHLCAVFVGSSLKVPGRVVNFPQQTVSLDDILDVLQGRPKPRLPQELQSWIVRAGDTVSSSFQEWRLLTKVGFKARDDCKCLLLVDQDRLPAIRPLSFQGAQDMMQRWGGQQYGLDVLEQIYWLSSGVPRILARAFETEGQLRSFSVAANAMSTCFATSYPSAAPYLNEVETAVPLLLSSAAKWKVNSDTDVVPGTNVQWGDIFNAGAAFPNGQFVTLPLVWWNQDKVINQTLTNELAKMGMTLKDFCPDPLALLSGKRGALQRGGPFERLFANTLVARFNLHCLEAGSDPRTTWVPLLKIYPTENKHLVEMFGGFSVSWPAGVLPQKKQVTVEDQMQRGIIINGNNANHDLLIPIRNDATKAEEYMAASLRYGEPKKAADLTKTKQTMVSKKKQVTMPNKLLQVASGSQHEGRQKFSGQGADVMDQLQDNKQYGIINGSLIVPSINLLKIV